MSKFILIRGKENSGKTTTAGILYQKLLLLPNAEKERCFKVMQSGKETSEICEDVVTGDFNAIILINGIKVGIISYGDVLHPVVKQRIDYYIKEGVTIIIHCCKSINKKGSIYNHILENYNDGKIHTIIFNEDINKFPKKHKYVSRIISLIEKNIEN